MTDLNSGMTVIADVDLADDVEFGVRLAATPGWLQATFGKMKTYLLASLATRFIPAGGTTGQVLAKNSGTDFDVGWAAGGGGGGSTNLDGLTDVDTSTTAPVDGDILRYDAGAGLWKPHAPVAGSGMTVCRLSKSADQASTAGTWNHVTFDVEDIKDDVGMHSTSTHTNRLVVPSGYTRARVSAGISFGGNNTGNRNVAVFKNTETTSPVAADFIFAVWQYSDWEAGNTIDTGWIPVTPGEWFSIGVDPEAANPNIQGNTGFSKCWAQLELA